MRTKNKKKPEDIIEYIINNKIPKKIKEKYDKNDIEFALQRIIFINTKKKFNSCSRIYVKKYVNSLSENDIENIKNNLLELIQQYENSDTNTTLSKFAKKQLKIITMNRDKFEIIEIPYEITSDKNIILKINEIIKENVEDFEIFVVKYKSRALITEDKKSFVFDIRLEAHSMNNDDINIMENN